MCSSKYYSTIISSIERISHEFYLSFVIITWYIGSVIGSIMAIHLHTINRNRSKLVLLATGISFILCLLIGTQLSIESSYYDYFLLRIVLGTLIGLIYLTSVIVRLQSNPTVYLCGFTIATIISISQTQITTEMCCVSLTLIYSLIALNLSSVNCLFPDISTKNVRPNIGAFNATFNLIVKQTRPLIYLAGAKLLTVFCFFLPFICIATQNLTVANVSVVDINNNILYDEDGNDHINNNNNININNANEIFNDLMVLLVTRLALGTITILLIRHNVNYLSIVYLLPLTLFLTILLCLSLFDLRRFIIEHTLVFNILTIIYVAFSLFVDVIGHRVAFNAEINFGSASASTMISLTFATFIEHLVDVAIVVIYLNDWISGQLIITAFSIILLSILIETLTTATERRYLIAIKQEIL